MRYKKVKHDVYYPCDICGWDSPSNVQFTSSGIEASYCQMHYKRKIIDEKRTTKRVKNQQKFLDEFRKAFTSVTVEGMENN